MAPPYPSTVALAGATSANGTARNGAAFVTFNAAAGTLIADLSVTIVTGSVVCTSKWQGSADGGTTWVDIKPMSNVSSVTTAATATLALDLVPSAWAFGQVRVVMTLSGATTAGASTAGASTAGASGSRASGSCASPSRRLAKRSARSGPSPGAMREGRSLRSSSASVAP